MKTVALLINLGTPASPNPKDVKRYLNEFLLDPNVINLPWPLRQLLVRRIIVPKRYRESARSYNAIWTKDGSPLLLNTQKVTLALQNELQGEMIVEYAMRYQNPSLNTVLSSFKKKDIENLIIFPMFPQYAAATTGSIKSRIHQMIKSWKRPPNISFIEQFATNPYFIKTFAIRGTKAHQYDHILFSFHGLPQKQIIKADRSGRCLSSPDCCIGRPLNNNCYRSHCLMTAQFIAKELQLSSKQYTLCFQSRLGKQEWLKPYARDVLKSLAQNQIKSLLVFSPSFVCDCLETLYEIEIEFRKEFLSHGGEKLDLVESLNDHPSWIKGLASLLRENQVIARENSLVQD